MNLYYLIIPQPQKKIYIKFLINYLLKNYFCYKLSNQLWSILLILWLVLTLWNFSDNPGDQIKNLGTEISVSQIMGCFDTNGWAFSELAYCSLQSRNEFTMQYVFESLRARVPLSTEKWIACGNNIDYTWNSKSNMLNSY